MPVKFWQCEDDPVVPYFVTKNFVERARGCGSAAYLRTFPYGGHEPQLVGEAVESPSGIDVFEGEKIPVTPAVEETFIWMNNYN